MKRKYLFVSVGFALFSMFFGSGNLVFPIAVGQGSHGHYLLAALGILITGVAVPFLGVFGMMLFGGDHQSFFSSFGKKGTFWFSFFALALMGPFGVLARCLTVAHGALELMCPGISLVCSSFIFCMLIYFLTVKKNSIIAVLGSILTPFLLFSIAAITLTALMFAAPLEATPDQGWEALKNGFLQGYQTMDLLAAFFFSSFIIKYLTNDVPNTNNPQLINTFLKAALIGGGLLSSVYLALVTLGWMYAPSLAETLPQEMLGKIAFEALGPVAAPLVCIAVVLACLTTAIVLTSLFADFLQMEISQGKINHSLALGVTLGIGFAISTLDFSGISSFLGPILEVSYPALIVLTFLNVAHKLWGITPSHWPVTLTLAAKVYFS